MNQQLPVGTFVECRGEVGLCPSSEDDDFYYWVNTPHWSDEKLLKASVSKIAQTKNDAGLPSTVILDAKGLRGVVIGGCQGQYTLVKFDDGSEVLFCRESLITRSPLDLLAEQSE